MICPSRRTSLLSFRMPKLERRKKLLYGSRWRGGMRQASNGGVLHLLSVRRKKKKEKEYITSTPRLNKSRERETRPPLRRSCRSLLPPSETEVKLLTLLFRRGEAMTGEGGVKDGGKLRTTSLPLPRRSGRGGTEGRKFSTSPFSFGGKKGEN